jgi:hypothetical protein
MTILTETRMQRQSRRRTADVGDVLKVDEREAWRNSSV